jgi:hypothetical protein
LLLARGPFLEQRQEEGSWMHVWVSKCLFLDIKM